MGTGSKGVRFSSGYLRKIDDPGTVDGTIWELYEIGTLSVS